MLDSQQRTVYHHFKVMQLRTHEDTGKGSECRLKFHFMFELVQKKRREHLGGYEWDINSNPQQRLFLSQSTHRLMEVINDFMAIVYTRVNIDD